jgi:hypothetical protein
MFKYLSVLLFFASCKKDEPTLEKQIKGVVINSLTKAPVASQTIELTVITQKTIKTNEPEWPNGKPVYYYTKYQTTSDQSGNYLFNVKIPDLPWSYNVNIPTADYVMTYRFFHIFPIDERFFPLSDSIFIERPGYIRYTIKTLSAQQNEMLYVSTPYQNKKIRPGSIPRLDAYYYKYNWAFEGKAEQVIMDTVPAETITNPEVEWLRVLPGLGFPDTVMIKKEKIAVHAGSTTNYAIQY